LELRAERDRLEPTRPDPWSWRPLASAEITALADALGGLISILQQASPVDRAAVYKELRLRLGYHPEKRQVTAAVDFARFGWDLWVSEGGLATKLHDSS
jgi:hypothetical protein